jgi:two-component system, NarL family, response regulator LiaR
MVSCQIRVLVADDHLVIRRGLATLLLAFNDIVLVGEAQNGAETLALCATIQPDVVLIDLLMPDMDSVEVTRAIRQRHPASQVVVLASLPLHELIHRALAAGASGCLLTNISAEELATAVRTAHTGQYVSGLTAVESDVRAAVPSSLLPDHGSDLTAREHEVLEQMARGFTNTQIGAQLNISRATVKFHVSSILSKFGASSRTEAAALAVQHRLIAGPGDSSAMWPAGAIAA